MPVSITQPSSGFSLLELLTVLCISALLINLVVPNYRQSLYRARRSDAISSLLTLQLAVERFRLTCPYYPIQLGAFNHCDTNNGTENAGLSTLAWNTNSALAYYQLQLIPPEAGIGISNGYRLSATAKGLQTMDTRCQRFYLDQNGKRTAVDSEGNTHADCW